MSKHVDQFEGEPFDLVVTVCDNARESCPVFPAAVQTLHWPFEDPAEFQGSESEVEAGLRACGRRLRGVLRSFCERGGVSAAERQTESIAGCEGGIRDGIIRFASGPFSQ